MNQILGSFSCVQQLINSQSSCIGIDYQPPTPAPNHHSHIIGGEDDEMDGGGASGGGVNGGANGIGGPGGAKKSMNRPRPSLPRLPSQQRLPDPDNLNQMPR